MMTIIKRAWTAVARKRRRSLTIALIMTLIFTLLIGTLTVQQTMGTAEAIGRAKTSPRWL